MTTNTNLTGVNYNNENDGYEVFEANMKGHFNIAINGGKKLFKTNIEGLFDIYLENLPKEAQVHYMCNACRHFINKFGGLVTIDENGDMNSVMWDENVVPVFFKRSIKAMRKAVLKSKVTGVFLAETATLGQPRTGEWTHLSVTVPRNYVSNSRLLTAGQVMAEKKEEFKMLTNALLEFSLDTAEQALTLLESETLYRGDRVLGVGKWFKELHEKRNSVKTSAQKSNIVWSAVATAPSGFCHVRSTMVGTLLDDISSGLSAQSVSRRFAEKMNPSNHMRSQSAPTQNAMLEAEKVVAKLGIENSLQRRYAQFHEIPTFLWQPEISKSVEATKHLGGVFSHLTPKDKAEPSTMSIPSAVMTWEKFNRTILPTAQSIEVLADNPNRLMAIVTAVDETSENILQWDNPFSWYYHGGIDGEVKRRVENAGGRYENNEIRASLIWENYTDLDLHCITPDDEHISFRNKRCRRSGGFLDIDMNAGSNQTMKPVENIRWSDSAISGHYKFYVHNFKERSQQRATPFKVELEVNGQIYNYHGEPLRDDNRVTVFEFDYIKGQQPSINSVSYSDNNSWNIQSNNFVKVNGITTSPNLWGENPVVHTGSHVFFLLDGAKDLSEGKGRGFFNETLKPELRQIRKTLELFTANTPIEDVEEASASGVGYSKDSEWNLTVKVKSNNSTRIIKIDRWD